MNAGTTEILVAAKAIATDRLCSIDGTPSPTSAMQMARMDILDRERTEWFHGGADWILGEIRRGNVTGFRYTSPADTHPIVPNASGPLTKRAEVMQELTRGILLAVVLVFVMGLLASIPVFTR